MGKQLSGLGRGLGTIIRDHDIHETITQGENKQGLQLQQIDLNLIDPNPFQPRKVFSKEEIRELAQTIKEHGLIQPITVRKHDGRYQIVSGERRTRASREAGLTQIATYVHELLSDRNMSEWALIENIQRVDLNPIEIAESYQQLINIHDYTHEKLAQSVGKSRSVITNALRLLKLPEKVKTWIQEGKLSASAARALLSPEISNPEAAAKKIIEQELNVREAENISKKHKESKAVKETHSVNPQFKEFVDKLREFFGIEVKLQHSAKDASKGTIMIPYYSMEDLNRIYQRLENL
ncbi:MAG: ParB/RepB/Spo0J family partition protein [Fibrobacter sp.]|jgi:ParB family chromosome partitioning protein|nr:ParB/RepB/Spo0J family partition protein [Fibrobacter sp.]